MSSSDSDENNSSSVSITVTPEIHPVPKYAKVRTPATKEKRKKNPRLMVTKEKRERLEPGSLHKIRGGDV